MTNITIFEPETSSSLFSSQDALRIAAVMEALADLENYEALLFNLTDDAEQFESNKVVNEKSKRKETQFCRSLLWMEKSSRLAPIQPMTKSPVISVSDSLKIRKAAAVAADMVTTSITMEKVVNRKAAVVAVDMAIITTSMRKKQQRARALVPAVMVVAVRTIKNTRDSGSPRLAFLFPT